MPSNPFDGFSFETGSMAPMDVSNDDAIALLKQPVASPFTHQVAGGTDAGIQRVNDNQSADSSVIAYRDANGRAVLTNMAKPLLPASPEERLASLFRPTPLTTDENGQIGVKTTQQTPEAMALMQQLGIVPDGVQSTQKPTKQEEQRATLLTAAATPVGITDGIAKLRSSTTGAEAKGIFDSVQQTILQERTKLEQEAFKFAENKLGIPDITAQINLSRQTDKASIGWYPGIGDSPATKSLLARLDSMRPQVDNEAKTFLQTNNSYKALTAAEKSATDEVTRVQRLEDQRETSRLGKLQSKENAETQANIQFNLARRARVEDEENKAVLEYEGLSTKQLARIKMRHAQDLASFGEDTDDREYKVKVMALVKRNSKDKKYQEAILAESPQQLAAFALQGNKIARDILIAEEAVAVGKSPEDIEAEFLIMERYMADQNLVGNVLKNRAPSDEDRKNAKAIQTKLNLAAKDFDPNKKLEATNQRLTFLFEAAETYKTNKFITDVGYWGSNDAILQVAIDAAQKTTGKRDVRNVFAAYLGDTTGMEKIKKAQAFQGLLEQAAVKHRGSAFGKPNINVIKGQLVDEVVRSGFRDTILSGRTGPLPAGLELLDMAAGALSNRFDGIVNNGN